MDNTNKGIAAIVIIAVVAIGIYAGFFCDFGSMEQEGPLKLTDYAGRTVAIEGDIMTVASNYPISTEVMLFLGGEDMICGSDSSTLGSDFMLGLYPGIADSMDLGYPWSTNIEQIVALDPDVFVMSGTSVDAADQLTGLGVPTLCLSFETPGDFNESLDVLGTVLGREDEAHSMADYYTETAEMITDKTDGIADDERPSVLFLSFGAKRIMDFQTPGQGMLQNSLIALGGGLSVSEEQPGGWNEINMDQVALWDPDVIIVTSYSSDASSEQLRDQILANEVWDVTKAKKEGNVYAFAHDWGSWDAPTPKWILGLCWMGCHIQPDIFFDTDIGTIAGNFYDEYYGISYEDAGVMGDIN